jgi:hypothetical protein
LHLVLSASCRSTWMQNRHLLSCRWWKDVHSCSAAALASDATAYQLPAVRVVRLLLLHAKWHYYYYMPEG